jgi:hypothetical protein
MRRKKKFSTDKAVMVYDRFPCSERDCPFYKPFIIYKYDGEYESNKEPWPCHLCKWFMPFDFREVV